MKKLKLVSFVQFVVIIDLIQTVYLTGLTQNGNAEFTGGSFKLDCVTDALDAIVQITDPSGVFAANCLIPTGSTYTCIPGPDSNYVASQDVASKTTTVTISTSSRASHEGGWTCTKFGTTPFSKTVTVITVGTLSEPSPPVPNFEVTTSTSKTMTVDVACVYPSAQITWEFVTDTLASTGVNSTGTCTNSGPTGVSCSDASANSSSCTFEVSPTSTDGLSAGTYKLKANLVVVGEVVSTGVSLVLSTVITISERTCECDAVLALGIIGILLFVVDVILTWIAHFQLHGKIEHCLSLVTESKSGEGKLEWKTKLCFFRAVVTTVICVIALILCIIGIAICKACNLGSPEQSETTGLILAAIGFAINLVVLILLIIMICLNRCRVLTISSSNPANERDGPDGQEGKHSAAESKPRTEVSPRSAGSPTSASKIRPKWKNNQVSDSNESDGSNDTPRGGKLGNVPPGRKLPPLTATALDVDGGQKSNSLAPLDTTETKKLRKKKKRRSKEEKQDNGE